MKTCFKAALLIQMTTLLHVLKPLLLAWILIVCTGIITALIANNFEKIRSANADRKLATLTKEQQINLIQKETRSKRLMFLARSKKLTPEAQKQLFATSREFQHHLTQNPNLTKEVQLMFTVHPDSNTRRRFAKNKNLTAAAQLLLSKDTSDLVQNQLSQNKNIKTSLKLHPSFIKKHQPEFYQKELENISPGAQEIVKAFMLHWEGNLDDLLQTAKQLLQATPEQKYLQ